MNDFKKPKPSQAKKHNVYLSLEYMYKPCVLVKICLTCFDIFSCILKIPTNSGILNVTQTEPQMVELPAQPRLSLIPAAPTPYSYEIQTSVSEPGKCQFKTQLYL